MSLDNNINLNDFTLIVGKEQTGKTTFLINHIIKKLNKYVTKVYNLCIKLDNISNNIKQLYNQINNIFYCTEVYHLFLIFDKIKKDINTDNKIIIIDCYYFPYHTSHMLNEILTTGKNYNITFIMIINSFDYILKNYISAFDNIIITKNDEEEIKKYYYLFYPNSSPSDYNNFFNKFNNLDDFDFMILNKYNQIKILETFDFNLSLKNVINKIENININ